MRQKFSEFVNIRSLQMPTVYEASFLQKVLISLTLASFHAPFYSMSHYVLEDKTSYLEERNALGSLQTVSPGVAS